MLVHAYNSMRLEWAYPQDSVLGYVGALETSRFEAVDFRGVVLEVSTLDQENNKQIGDK